MEMQDTTIGIDISQKIPSYFDLFLGDLSNNLIKRSNEILIEGLKRKGYEFSNPRELQNFVARNCTVENRTDLKEKRYFVYNKPFMVHHYVTEETVTFFETTRRITMHAQYGEYRFV